MNNPLDLLVSRLKETLGIDTSEANKLLSLIISAFEDTQHAQQQEECTCDKCSVCGGEKEIESDDTSSQIIIEYDSVKAPFALMLMGAHITARINGPLEPAIVSVIGTASKLICDLKGIDDGSQVFTNLITYIRDQYGLYFGDITAMQDMSDKPTGYSH